MGGLAVRLRDTQCWSSLAVHPCTSSQSLALEYSTMLTSLVPISAIRNGHYRLATVASVATVGPFAPIFAAGLCTFERTAPGTLKVVYSKPAFVMIIIYLVLFALATLLAVPRREELLLRPAYSIADVLKPFSRSDFMYRYKFSSTVAAQTQEMFRAKVLLTEYEYQLGVIDGTCGHKHLGVEAGHAKRGGDLPSIQSAKALVAEQNKPQHRRGFRRKAKAPDDTDQAQETGQLALPQEGDEEQ